MAKYILFSESHRHWNPENCPALLLIEALISKNQQCYLCTEVCPPRMQSVLAREVLWAEKEDPCFIGVGKLEELEAGTFYIAVDFWQGRIRMARVKKDGELLWKSLPSAEDPRLVIDEIVRESLNAANEPTGTQD